MRYNTAMSITAPASADAPTVRDLNTAALAAIAERWAGRLEGRQQLGNDPIRRTGLRLVPTDDYDVWLLRWPPGTRVSPHDHGGSAGAFVVVSGELVELRWNDSIAASRIVGRGDIVTIEDGMVHDVVATNCLSYSVHVYSPPLAKMSFYDESGVEVMSQMVVEDADLTSQRLELGW